MEYEKDEIVRMQKLLESASVLVKQRNPLNDINLFSILGMENKEVSAHSAFLFYIFKPFQGEDGRRDDLNLRILFQHLRCLDPRLAWEVEPRFLDIQREVSFDEGRLDFLLKFDSDAAVIELKVWAGEQPDQIKRYQRYLKQSGYSANNVFFLTPDGKKATTGDAFSISLKEDIKKVLEEICKERATHLQYVSVVEQYLSLVVKLTGGYTQMDASVFFKTKNEIIASEKLYECRQEVLTEILRRFIENLRERIVDENENLAVTVESGNSLHLVRDNNLPREKIVENYYRSGIGCWPAIIFEMNKEALKPELKKVLKDGQELFFYVEIETNLYCGITTRKNIFYPVDLSKEFAKEPFKSKKQEESAACKFNGKDARLFDRFWWSWEYINYNGHRINFKEYRNDDGLFSILEDSLQFIDGSIDDIAKSIITSFQKQYGFIFES